MHDVDPDADDESGLAGSREGHLVELFEQAGLADVEPGSVSVTARVRHVRGVVGAVHARRRPRRRATSRRLDDAGRAAVRAACAAPTCRRTRSTITASAWAARGKA